MASIARVWFGTTSALRIDEYTEYVKKTGVPALMATPGNQGVLLLKRLDGDSAEIGVISFWESRESIVAFAGPQINKAVYYPEDHKFLTELTPELVHYEISGTDKIELGTSNSMGSTTKK
jgi:heme-degrading monooxygenase HmoA